MGSRLDRVTDWSKHLKRADFRVAALARLCGVSERQLRRFFIEKFGCGPREWMAVRKFEEASESLSAGARVKDAGLKAGFSHLSNFSRAFKDLYKARAH